MMKTDHELHLIAQKVVEDVMNLEHYKGMLSPAMLLDNRQHNNFANFISLIVSINLMVT